MQDASITSASFEKVRFRRPEQFGSSLQLRPLFLDFHEMRVRRDHEYAAHVHTLHELILVEAGRYACALNGTEVELGPGDVLVIQPGDRHQDHLRAGQRHFVLHFSVEVVDRATPDVRLFRPGVQTWQQISRGQHRRDATLLQEIAREAEGPGLYSGVIQDRLLEALFWRTMRNLPPDGLSAAVRQLPKFERARDRIMATMLAHVEANVSTLELARKLRMSPRHLTNTCRTLFGLPPAKLLLGLKIARADDLLRQGELRVKEISDRLGFRNAYHFSRAFKRVRGVAPSVRLAG